MIDQYETLQLENDLLTYLPGKCLTVYKVMAKNTKQ